MGKDSEPINSTELSPQVYRGEVSNTTPMVDQNTRLVSMMTQSLIAQVLHRTLERLDVMMENMMVMMKKQETELENIKSNLKDIKQRI